MVVQIALLAIFYCCFPALIIYGANKVSVLNKIGTVVLAYAIGILLGNTGLLPSISSELNQVLGGKAYLPAHEFNLLLQQGKLSETDRLPNLIAQLQEILMTITIPLAIPLLLFSLNIKLWLGLAKRALLSMILGIISLVIIIFLGFYLFGAHIDQAWKVGGMLIGIYTGGTPNLAAIATALHVNPNTFILVNTYEIIAGFIFLLFILTIAQRLLNLTLPSFKESVKKSAVNIDKGPEAEEFSGKINQAVWIDLGKALALAILIFAIGGGISLLVPSSSQMAVVILSITTLAVGASLLPKVNRLKQSFPLGMYLILIFSLVVASMANLKALLNIEFLDLFAYVALGVFGTMLLHLLLSKIFKIDTDTTIITMTALSFSPPFVPVVASALKNRPIIISGLAVGTLGYIFGNYLGIMVAWGLKLLS